MLRPSADYSINDVLISVLPQTGEVGALSTSVAEAPGDVPVAVTTAIEVQVSEKSIESQAVLSSGSESQGGETDPPVEKETGQYISILWGG